MGKSHTKLTLVIVFLLSCVSAYAAGFANEKLHYVISYKWGLIHKDAGEATLTLRRQGADYRIMLAAKTKPWADKIFMVRDTLPLWLQTVSGLRTTRRFRTKAGNMARTT